MRARPAAAPGLKSRGTHPPARSSRGVGGWGGWRMQPTPHLPLLLPLFARASTSGQHILCFGHVPKQAATLHLSVADFRLLAAHGGRGGEGSVLQLSVLTTRRASSPLQWAPQQAAAFQL